MPRRSRTGGQPKKETPAQVRARTEATQRAFLEAFVIAGNISGASRTSQVSRDTHYAWLKDDPAYAAAYKVAADEAIDLLEQEARKRAISGARPSDLLLIFLLKAGRPEKYRERLEHTGKGGGPIQVKKTVTFGGRYKPKPKP